jgi:quercetin dioxygenase-like cupin family protein
MDKQYPKSIDNGHGETLTFVRRETVDGVEKVVLAGEVQPGKGPPMHAHLRQTESLTCIEGELGYEIQGEEPKVLGPGQTITFAPGVPHRFWAAGDKVLRCEGYVSPPDNVEYFLGKIYESMKENNAPDGRPGDYDAAFLLGHYRDEYAMPAIPAFVRKAIFPILRGVGRLTGKHRRFDGAPPPVAR